MSESESKKTEQKSQAPASKSTTLTKGGRKVSTESPTVVTQLKSEGWVVGK